VGVGIEENYRGLRSALLSACAGPIYLLEKGIGETNRVTKWLSIDANSELQDRQ